MSVLMRAPTKQIVVRTAFSTQPSGLLTPHCYQATCPVQPLASASPGPTHKEPAQSCQLWVGPQRACPQVTSCRGGAVSEGMRPIAGHQVDSE